MRSRVLIVIGIAIAGFIAAAIGAVEYQSVYNHNCFSDGGYVTGFLRCTYVREDFPGPKIEGRIAQEICSITGGECPPYYIGNIQEDGSVMVGMTFSDKGKEKQFVFFIKNGTLSYEVKENEN